MKFSALAQKEDNSLHVTKLPYYGSDNLFMIEFQLLTFQQWKPETQENQKSMTEAANVHSTRQKITVIVYGADYYAADPIQT